MGFQLQNSRSDVRKRQQGGHTWLWGDGGYILVLVEDTTYLLLCAEVWKMHSAAASPRIKAQSTVQAHQKLGTVGAFRERADTVLRRASWGVQGEGLSDSHTQDTASL